jgi:hypothetical protein
MQDEFDDVILQYSAKGLARERMEKALISLINSNETNSEQPMNE